VSIGLVLVVRDEAGLLAANLAYHRAMGVQRAYVFLDRCTDGSREVVAAHPWVEVRDADLPAGLRTFSTHQRRLMEEGLERARADGLDWLLHLDADEFAAPGLKARLTGRARDLPALLARVPREADAVVLEPWEVVPLRPVRDVAFHRLHLFQRGRPLVRRILDPGTGEVRVLDRVLGHSRGKSLVRTRARARAASAHRWEGADGAALRTVRAGMHFHYVVTGPEAWRAKFARFAEYADRWESGRPVTFPKQAWKEAAPGMSPEEARAYYARWIALGPRDVLPGLLRAGVVYDPWVERVLRRAGAA